MMKTTPQEIKPQPFQNNGMKNAIRSDHIFSIVENVYFLMFVT